MTAILLYNVHVDVNADAVDEWLEYMDRHIPEVLETGCFDGATLHSKRDEVGGFLVSYETSTDRFDHYQKTFAEALRNDHSSLFDGRVSAFREILQPVKDF